MSVFAEVDGKYVPLYRVLWVASLPHFCGEDDCEREGDYEIRLEDGESVWGTRQERDTMLAALEAWAGDDEPPHDESPEQN